MKYLHLIILILFTVSIFAITNEEIRFLCDKEQFQLLAKHYDTIQKKIKTGDEEDLDTVLYYCLLYTSPSPRDRTRYRMPSSA